MIWNWFSDPEDTSPAYLKMARNILVFTIVATIMIMVILSGIFPNIARNSASLTALSIAAVLESISLYLVLTGKPGMAKVVVPLALMATVTYSAVSANGLHDISMVGFPVVIIISALLLRDKLLPIVTPLSSIAVVFVGYADVTGINQSPMADRTDVGDVVIAVILILATSLFLQLLISRLGESSRIARQNELAQMETNKQLLDLQNSLEKRIIERTMQITNLNKASQRRNEQFKTIAQVSRLIANVREVNELLPTITSVISERFGFYHVGIFLLDDAKQYAILSASNSEGGQRMLRRGHRLRVGETGLVGYTASKGIARIALDTGIDSVYFNNPDLPETRSELALPLQISDEIIGVLDVQSVEAEAFVQEDIDTLSTLADQVAIAIHNAELFRNTQKAIAESQALFSTVVRQAWKTNVQSTPQIGYKFTGTMPTKLDTPLTSKEITAAMELGNVTQSHPESGERSLVIPLKLRGEAIGVITVKMPSDLDLGEDETDIVSAAAERIALALENSSLLEDSQRRASREKNISEMSARISAGTDIETILKTAIRELGSQIGGANISVEIGNENE
jgi:GAF domain-containing protein